MKKLPAFEMRKLQKDHFKRQVEQEFNKIYEAIESHAMNVPKPAKVSVDCKKNAVGDDAIKMIKDLGYKVTRDESEDRTIIVSWEDDGN